jgi:hypothetical protein
VAAALHVFMARAPCCGEWDITPRFSEDIAAEINALCAPDTEETTP